MAHHNKYTFCAMVVIVAATALATDLPCVDDMQWTDSAGNSCVFYADNPSLCAHASEYCQRTCASCSACRCLIGSTNTVGRSCDISQKLAIDDDLFCYLGADTTCPRKQLAASGNTYFFCSQEGENCIASPTSTIAIERNTVFRQSITAAYTGLVSSVSIYCERNTLTILLSSDWYLTVTVESADGTTVVTQASCDDLSKETRVLLRDPLFVRVGQKYNVEFKSTNNVMGKAYVTDIDDIYCPFTTLTSPSRTTPSGLISESKYSESCQGASDPLFAAQFTRKSTIWSGEGRCDDETFFIALSENVNGKVIVTTVTSRYFYSFEAQAEYEDERSCAIYTPIDLSLNTKDSPVFGLLGTIDHEADDDIMMTGVMTHRSCDSGPFQLVETTAYEHSCFILDVTLTVELQSTPEWVGQYIMLGHQNGRPYFESMKAGNDLLYYDDFWKIERDPLFYTSGPAKLLAQRSAGDTPTPRISDGETWTSADGQTFTSSQIEITCNTEFKQVEPLSTTTRGTTRARTTRTSTPRPIDQTRTTRKITTTPIQTTTQTKATTATASTISSKVNYYQWRIVGKDIAGLTQWWLSELQFYTPDDIQDAIPGIAPQLDATDRLDGSPTANRQFGLWLPFDFSYRPDSENAEDWYLGDIDPTFDYIGWIFPAQVQITAFQIAQYGKYFAGWRYGYHDFDVQARNDDEEDWITVWKAKNLPLDDNAPYLVFDNGLILATPTTSPTPLALSTTITTTTTAAATTTATTTSAPAQQQQAASAPAAFNYDEDEEEDENAAPAANNNAATANTANTNSSLRFYNVVVSYDQYYCSPRMYLFGYKCGAQNVPLTKEEMMQDVFSANREKTATIDPHPFVQAPCISIHPCRHAEMMKRTLDRLDQRFTDEQEDVPEGERFPFVFPTYMALFVFLKFITAVVPTVGYDVTIDMEM